MSLRIIIDGYNLIRQSPILRSYDNVEIVKGRDKLIEVLAHYRSLKRHPMLVVFDGWQEGNVTEQRTKEKGIDIIYSKRGEKADEVIKRLVLSSKDELIVVTSDREITHFCQSRSCEVISSLSFEEKIEFSLMAHEKGLEEDDDKPSVCLIGISYKPNVSDTRNSPSLELLKLLEKSGYKTVLYDPMVRLETVAEVVSDLSQAIDSCKYLVIGTGHTEVLESLKRHDLSNKTLFDPWSVAGELAERVKRYVGLTIEE